MKKHSKLTLVGLIVVIIVILFAFLITIPALLKIKKIEARVNCGKNLKGLGTAMTVYANDYNGQFPILPGYGPWAKELGFDYKNPTPDFSENGAEGNVSRTITASWYLLVREADVSPNTFVCEASENTVFKRNKKSDPDLVELWDFGPDPYKHVSYAYHNPYGKYPANKNRSAAFAIAADMSPWFKNGNIVKPGLDGQPPQLLKDFRMGSNTHAMNSNASHHSYVSQNVLYADGHAANEHFPNVGVKYDNIYTFWSVEENPTEQDIQGGTAPTSRSKENDAKSKDDSFLVI